MHKVLLSCVISDINQNYVGLSLYFCICVVTYKFANHFQVFSCYHLSELVLAVLKGYLFNTQNYNNMSHCLNFCMTCAIGTNEADNQYLKGSVQY